MKALVFNILIAFLCHSLLNGNSITDVQENITKGNFLEARDSINYIITDIPSIQLPSASSNYSNVTKTIPLPNSVFSLRKIVYDYSGYVLRIRRNSDNLEANVSFDENGIISNNSPITVYGVDSEIYTYNKLEDFLQSDDAFVHTWYDQCYTNNITQEVYSKQPKIAENGELLTDGLRFDGTNDALGNSNTGAIDASNGISVFTVHKNRKRVHLPHFLIIILNIYFIYAELT